MMEKVKIASIVAVIVLLVAGISVMFVYGGSSDSSGDEDDSDSTDDTSSDDDSSDDNSTSNDEAVTASIVLGTVITVNGSSISTDTSSAVYKSTSTSGFTIINIVEAGTYTISGTAEETQILVNADDDSEVLLILDGMDISCSSAPAILIYNAYDPLTVGEAGVTIQLADDSTNTIDGSHTDENDAALSADVSLLIEGNGTLEITADMEGIETWMHLTIDSGTIIITSAEDAMNANNDGVSYITINGGAIYADASNGTDGDGIDSNGYIVINGGTVFGFSSGENSGLDSDLGTIINGGTVFATGKMNDGVASSSDQTYIDFDFSSTLSSGKLVYVADQSGNCVIAFKTLASYSTFIFSSSSLSSGITYSIYVGGTVSGTFDTYDVCASFTVTSAGTLQTSSLHSGM
jgi:hypothetical protein